MSPLGLVELIEKHAAYCAQHYDYPENQDKYANSLTHFAEWLRTEQGGK